MMALSKSCSEPATISDAEAERLPHDVEGGPRVAHPGTAAPVYQRGIEVIEGDDAPLRGAADGGVGDDPEGEPRDPEGETRRRAARSFEGACCSSRSRSG